MTVTLYSFTHQLYVYVSEVSTHIFFILPRSGWLSKSWALTLCAELLVTQLNNRTRIPIGSTQSISSRANSFKLGMRRLKCFSHQKALKQKLKIGKKWTK